VEAMAWALTRTEAFDPRYSHGLLIAEARWFRAAESDVILGLVSSDRLGTGSGMGSLLRTQRP